MLKQVRSIIATGALLSLLTVPASARNVTITGTAPTQDNEGTCAIPKLVAAPANNPVKGFFEWLVGTTRVELDSLSTTGGATFSRNYNRNPGTYSLKNWWSDAGGVGCDTTIVVTVLKGSPYRGTIYRQP